ncbi:tagaturonate reductase [Vagococcus sp. BWB3-3]|uniref:Tagaturonate reductase n=1 Tax=Vagococcus allomyrinae TaxID=2794353 RepID=A0A940P909_9ENTE|nr:tagaturonate reductase [Vagococcus allomyrinae]MBP1043954.1 tagaturonate reductase [Vagococcus allomyrinae]
MKKLNKQHTVDQRYPEKVIQFGEGNFMRGFVDWQLQQMNQQGLFQGSAVVVQPIAQGLGEMLAEQDYLYTVLLDGILNDQVINSAEIVSTVNRVINPYDDYQSYLDLALDDQLSVIISNTTEAGIQFLADDSLSNQPPTSFPGKLTALLARRFDLKKAGFTIIPCELIDRNGEKLKEIVLQYAEQWGLGADFRTWLQTENTFCCSLVDRIVPGYPREDQEELQSRLGYRDQLMVKAEPFLLWVIEGPASLKDQLPLAKAGLNVVVTDDMTPYRERKVHLLNGPHTAMVPLGLLAGLETVEDVMLDEDFSQFVDQLMAEEIIPVLDLPQSELISYANSVKERFKNPFIRHELTAIALNSLSKFKARLLPLLVNYQKQQHTLPPLMTLALAGLITFYRGDYPLQDDQHVLDTFAEAWQRPETVVPAIFSNHSLWEQDLSQLPGLVEAVEADLSLLEKGSRAALQTKLRGESYA